MCMTENTLKRSKGTHHSPLFHRLLLTSMLFAVIAAGCFLLMNADDSNAATIDGLEYSFSGSKATVTGYSDSPVSLTIPSSVTYESTEYSVTSIGSYSFEGCTSLASVTIPDSVESIGYGAFRGCTSLASVVIPGSVTSIGSGAFAGCASLSAITVEEGNTAYTSDDGALFNNDKTKLVQYPAGKTDSSYTVPGSVTSIESYAFRGCTSLASVVIPDSVESIGEYAFGGCTSLASVTIPDSVESIGYGAFRGCTSLASVVIPGSVKSIGSYAFYGCTSLASVTIPGSVTSIGSSAFYECTSLTAIEVGGGNTAYSSENGVLFDKAKTQLIQYPAGKTDSSYTVPGSVTSIGYGAFEGCTSLASVTIPDSVESIGYSAFERCTSLTAIEVGGGNTAYSSENGVLFDKAKTQLIQYPAGKTDSSYTVPGSVKSIEDAAFISANNLESIIVGENNPSYSSSSGCLYDKTGETLVVCPAGLKSATVGKDTTWVVTGAFSGKNLSEVVFSAGATTTVELGGFYDCTGLSKIVIEETANVVFVPSAITFLGEQEHVIDVTAPKGYKIPDSALYGNVKITYSEPSDPKGEEFPILYVAIVAVAIVALIGAAIAIKRSKA